MKCLQSFPLTLQIMLFRKFASKKKIISFQNKFKFQNVIADEPSKVDNSNIPIDKFENKLLISGDLLEQSQQRIEKKRIKDASRSRNKTSNNHSKYEQKIIRSRLPLFNYKGEILYGIHPVYLALLQNRRTFFEIFMKSTDVTEKSHLRDEIRKMAELLGIKLTEGTSRDFKYIAPNVVHQGVCMDVDGYPLMEYEENEKIETDVSHSDVPLWLVLDEIQDPMNVGAILRSAYYFGVHKIFITTGYSCKLTPTVSKASSGALEVLDIYKVSDLVNFLKKKKQDGWHIVSTDAYNESVETNSVRNINLNEFKTTKPTVLILGNEGKGSSSLIKALCDCFVSIYPCRNLHIGIDSLNVSVAAAILLHHLSKKFEAA